jgi:hypothetical protein
MKLLHKTRASVEGQDVDFIFLDDADFRCVIQGSPCSFVNEHKEEDIAVVVVGYPSLTSVGPEGINCCVTLLGSLYPQEVAADQA